MKILYFDCFAGIAGDMTVAALLESGCSPGGPQGGAGGAPALSFSLSSWCREGLPPWNQPPPTLHVSVIESDRHHRHYADISRMIEESSLPAGVAGKAQRIFLRLAEAEAKVHGVEIGQVHFHEVGAVDSIVDIVGTAVCLDYLGVEEIYASAVPLGSGCIETAHGRLPVPAPATAELMRGMPVHFQCGPGERVTPTGAAILAAMANGFGAPPRDAGRGSRLRGRNQGFR